MQPFTITWGYCWWSRIAGRNPLVRRSDRIQAWLFSVAILINVLAIPVAGAIGTSVHDARARFYAEEAKHRHAVTATAIENSAAEVGPGPADVSFFVRAYWIDGGSNHVDVVKWPDEATVGDQTDIWVDDAGNAEDPPASPSRAATDAVGAAFWVWFTVMATTAGSAYLIRLRLIKRRYVDWDRELQAHYQS
ncbi:MAG: Rv1733c family protein [Mycobacterium sp.]